MDLETLLERYGDHELGLGDDTATLQTVLESQGDATYESAHDVHQSIIGWSVTTRSAGRTTRTAAAERKPRRTARRSRCRQLAARFENEICLIPSVPPDHAVRSVVQLVTLVARARDSALYRRPPLWPVHGETISRLALACRLIILVQHLSPLSHDQAPTQTRVLRVQRHYHPQPPPETAPGGPQSIQVSGERRSDRTPRAGDSSLNPERIGERDQSTPGHPTTAALVPVEQPGGQTDHRDDRTDTGTVDPDGDSIDREGPYTVVCDYFLRLPTADSTRLCNLTYDP